MNRMVFRTPSFTWSKVNRTKKPYKYVHCTYMCTVASCATCVLCEHTRDGNIFSQTISLFTFYLLYVECWESRTMYHEHNQFEKGKKTKETTEKQKKKRKKINLIIVGPFRLMQRPMIEISVFSYRRYFFFVFDDLRNFAIIKIPKTVQIFCDPSLNGHFILCLQWKWHNNGNEWNEIENCMDILAIFIVWYFWMKPFFMAIILWYNIKVSHYYFMCIWTLYIQVELCINFDVCSFLHESMMSTCFDCIDTK